MTWLAKLLGGNECQWAVWFKAHNRYAKVERNAEQLQEWNREHTALMKVRREQLERDGWTVFMEDANSFTLEGQTADVAGKPDIVATLDDQVLIVDGKTGRARDSDRHQVGLYLYALPIVRRDLIGKALTGEVTYSGRRRPIVLGPPLPEQVTAMTSLIRAIAGSTPLERVPSEWECSRCDLSDADCPARFKGRQVGQASGF